MMLLVVHFYSVHCPNVRVYVAKSLDGDVGITNQMVILKLHLPPHKNSKSIEIFLGIFGSNSKTFRTRPDTIFSVF